MKVFQSLFGFINKLFGKEKEEHISDSEKKIHDGIMKKRASAYEELARH